MNPPPDTIFGFMNLGSGIVSGAYSVNIYRNPVE